MMIDKLKSIYKIWIGITAIISKFITVFILIILFYLVVTPIGILAKLFRKKFIDLKFNTGDESFWKRREVTLSDKSDAERQF